MSKEIGDLFNPKQEEKLDSKENSKENSKTKSKTNPVKDLPEEFDDNRDLKNFVSEESESQQIEDGLEEINIGVSERQKETENYSEKILNAGDNIVETKKSKVRSRLI